jgi:altronate hydrolase
MSLIDIEKLPTAENSAIRLHRSDNIAVARVPLSPGQVIRIDGITVTVADPVPAGHKVVLVRVPAGERVKRWGEPIGRAIVTLEPGRHVHTHNVAYEEDTPDYVFPEGDIGAPPLPSHVPTFLGYQREDGRAGTRNYIAVVAASNCAAHTAEWIAGNFEGEPLPESVDGVAAFPHGDGCGQSGGIDLVQLRRTLSGVLDHPNVSAAIILGLGCEVNQIDHYLGQDTPRSKRLIGMTLQSSGGTRGTVEAATREIRKLIERAAGEKRVEVPASKIILGLNCGGSDSFSGITANPALGVTSDILAGYQATAVLAETTECFGAEHLLVRRARNREVAERFLGFIRSYKAYLKGFGPSFNFNDNPSPGNKDGGLTNILEKSLGAAAKAGSTPMMDAVDYAERITSPGFVFMNTPGYDPASLSGLAAGGANLIAFTTGRGSAIGFPTIPVLKIASNSHTFRRMPENMDVNAGRIADGEATIDGVGREIFDMLLRVASGERTCSEKMGHKEFVPWRIGPVL